MLVAALIGLAAGLFSALFGVGGGILIVPALLAFCRFEIKPATATSLAAIGITAAAGVARYGSSGHVEWLDALLIGVPAMLGALLGAKLQRQVSGNRLQLAFSLLVAAVAVRLLAS